MTHANVAAAAGYSKATLYVHWSRPVDLLRAAFSHVGTFSHGTVTGDLRADLVDEAEAFRRVLIEDRLAAAMIALADRASLDDEVAEMRDTFLTEGQSQLISLLEQAAHDGRIRSDLNLQAAADMLSGALSYRIAVMGTEVGEAYVRELVSVFLDGARPPRCD